MTVKSFLLLQGCGTDMKLGAGLKGFASQVCKTPVLV